MDVRELLQQHMEGRLLRGRTVHVLTEARLQEIRQRTGIHERRELDRLCFEMGIIPERFYQLVDFYGTVKPVADLLASHIGIIGADELGAALVPLLAQQGIGRVTLVDDEPFESLQSVIGGFNMGTEYREVAGGVRIQNIEEMFAAAQTRLLICTKDDPQTVYLLQSYAKANGIPVFYLFPSGKIIMSIPIFPDSPDVIDYLNRITRNVKQPLTEDGIRFVSEHIVREALCAVFTRDTGWRGNVLWLDTETFRFSQMRAIT